MNTPLHIAGHSEEAIKLARNGYRLVVVRPGSKAPMLKGWQSMNYTEDDLRRLFENTDLNVGIRTGGDLVVLDIDSADPTKLEWVIDRCGDTPMRVRTPSGGLHLYYRARIGVAYGNGVKLRDQPYDLRWNGAQAVCPWSRNAEGIAYQWAGPILPVSQLPILKVSALRERKRHYRSVVPLTIPTILGTGGIKDIRAYIRRIPSVQGANGSRGLMRVCLLLVEDGQALDHALAILQDWNRECAVPEWSQAELTRALSNAFKRKHVGLGAGGGRRS